MRLKIAFRNTFRNKRRTALNVFMIGAGVTSLVLFQGFSYQMIENIREGTIRSNFGHLQIAQEAFWEQTGESLKDNLIPDFGSLISKVRANPFVTSASGRLDFYGLIGSRDRSIAAHLLTLDPVIEKSRLEAMNIIKGVPIAPGPVQQILLGSGLASSLRAKVGDNLNLLGYTYDGVVNAFDMDVVGIFQTGLSEIDNVTAILTLDMAQRLLDTDSVEKIVINLKKTDLTDSAKSQISYDLASTSKTLHVKPWYDLAKLYREVASFYKVYDRVIQAIILSLILIGILNTVGMSIFERTGEIGTMRALGETEKNVIGQFVLEGVVLGALGGLTGMVSAVVIAYVVNFLKLPLVLPGTSLPVAISIALPFSNFLEAALLTLFISTLAATIPAIRATKLNIVDALRRNI